MATRRNNGPTVASPKSAPTDDAGDKEPSIAKFHNPIDVVRELLENDTAGGFADICKKIDYELEESPAGCDMSYFRSDLKVGSGWDEFCAKEEITNVGGLCQFMSNFHHCGIGIMVRGTEMTVGEVWASDKMSVMNIMNSMKYEGYGLIIKTMLYIGRHPAAHVPTRKAANTSEGLGEVAGGL